MRIFKGLLFVLFVSFYGSVSAQDIHYTMFDMAPINLNPAYTGFYEGTFRIGGIYRSQWQGLGTNNPAVTSDKFGGFKTPSAYIDAPFGNFMRIGKYGAPRSWFGGGLNFYNDQVGDLSTTSAELALAAHFGFGQTGNTRLSIGVKGGIINQQVGSDADFTFGSELRGSLVPVDPGMNYYGSSASSPDFSAGLILGQRFVGGNVELGFAFNHLTQPDFDLNGNGYKLPSNILGSLKGNFELVQGKFSIRPMFFYQTMSKAFEFNAQALGVLHFNNTKDINFLFGGGYRVSDAAFARLGFELKGLTFGAAYDFNLSNLSLGNSNYSGINPRGMGFELGLQYIAKLYKEPVVKEILFNPRF